MENEGQDSSDFLKALNSFFKLPDYALLIIVALGMIYLAGQLLFDAIYDAIFLWTQHTIPHLLSEMMFVLIIMELFRQVLSQINKKAFSLNPFLYVGLIASVRGLLLTQMSITMGDIEWYQGITQIAVYGGIILLLVVCYFVYNMAYKKYHQQV